MNVKRGIVKGLCCLLTMLCISGCTSNKDYGLDKENPVTLTLWHYYSGAQKTAFDHLVTEFNDSVGKENGIVIDAVSKGSIGNITKGLKDNMRNVESQKKLPNMFAAYLDTAQPLEEKDKLVSLETYMEKSELEEYVYAYLAAGKYEGSLDTKIFPIAKASEVLILNKEKWNPFAKAKNFTTDDLSTWEGLAKVAESYYTYSNGKSFFARDALMNYLLTGAQQLQDDVFEVKNSKGSFHIKEETMKKLWDAYYVPFINSYYEKNGRFASDDMKTLDVIASVSSTAGVTFFPEEVINEQGNSEPVSYIVLPVPGFKECDPISVTQGAGIAITKSDESKEYASILFLQWLTNEERNITFSASSGYLPVKKNANSIDVWEKTVKDNKLEVSDLLKQTINVSFEQTKNSKVIEAVDFPNAYEARTYLENALCDKAKKDQTEINKRLANNEERSNVLTPYLKDSNFTTWFESTSKGLKQILEGNKE